MIDLVRERVAQRVPEKLVMNGIRVDPAEEILANKLCALLSRSEIRDLVDVRAFELAGYLVEDALAAAALKDAGLTLRLRSRQSPARRRTRRQEGDRSTRSGPS